MSNFKIGEKVVCINDECGWLDGQKKLVKNQIYTVLWTSETDVGVILNDAGWDKSRFRKLDHDFAENLLKEISETMKSETILK